MSVRVEELLARAALPKGQHMNHTSRCTAQESHTPRASTGITHSRRQHKGQRRNHKHPRGQHRNHTPKGQHRNHTTQGTAYVTSQESHTPGASTGSTHPSGQHKNHTPLGTAQESHTPGDNTGITQRTMQPAAITQDITELRIDISNVRTCANSQIVMLFDRDINKRFVLLWSIWDTP